MFVLFANHTPRRGSADCCSILQPPRTDSVLCLPCLMVSPQTTAIDIFTSGQPTAPGQRITRRCSRVVTPRAASLASETLVCRYIFFFKLKLSGLSPP